METFIGYIINFEFPLKRDGEGFFNVFKKTCIQCNVEQCSGSSLSHISGEEMHVMSFCGVIQ